MGRAIYVSSVNGDDANSGYAPEKAFRSLRKVNQMEIQPGDQILAEMIRQCSMSGDEKQIFLKITGKKNCRVIAVYSPVRRIGKTTYAIRLGRKLAKEANVLYLGMETYGGEGGHFPEHRHWQMSCTMQGRNRAISERYLQLL